MATPPPSPYDPVAKRECPKKSMKNCMGCRLLAGSGMLLASGYVFMAARRNLRGGGSTTIGTVAQMVFAAGSIWGKATPSFNIQRAYYVLLPVKN
uniref:Distal membrane-arm assembly complex protein 1-like domain-containing protein n=1 Tax=Erpetoichthys calabaricus TaxID=27687 RepID=A0A8C4X6P0_ERPCA